MAGYGLVNLIREFCDSFNVIIPFKAFSCATLISLGADNILMAKMGQLSPIDPSAESPLGPRVPMPGQPGVFRTIPVNVEDVINYINFAKEQLALKDEESLVRIFELLSQNVHPLALGHINRIREQIGFLARTLLSYHERDKEKIEKIVETVIRGRFTHDYLIGRKEAKEVIGLNVMDIPSDLEEDIVKLYGEYDKILNLSVPYHPETVLGAADVEMRRGILNRAIIEANNRTYVFRTEKEVRRVQVTPPQVPAPTVGYQETIISEMWLEDNNI